MSKTAQKVIFLDRDGTLNTYHAEHWRVDMMEIIEGVPEGLKKLQDAGFALAIVTNQGGIEVGKYPEESVKEFHQKMLNLFSKEGVTIDAVAYCPHATVDCECRKPKPGMAKEIEDKIGAIDYASSWMIGDKEKDVAFGQAIGVKTAFIDVAGFAKKLKLQPDLVVDSLLKFAQTINK